jgi:hypothetical protein
MLRNTSATLVVLALLGTNARAQFLAVGPGSTVEGDYLRGVGVASYGMGVYNLATAEANSINADTFMRLNEYFSAVIKNDYREKAEIRERRRAEREKSYNANLERIRQRPEERDLMIGDALNSVLEQLNDPKIHPSTYRKDPVPLSSDVIRRIPFRIDKEGAKFSLQRLSPKGKGKWPVAFQDPQFALERRAYERAVDNALEQQIEGKMEIEAITAVDTAIQGLDIKLGLVVPPGKDKLYREAKARLRELKESAELLRREKIERVIGAIDRYSGTTVDDLRVFMQDHHLRFGAADNEEERNLYARLYESLLLQREVVKVVDNEPKK